MLDLTGFKQLQFLDQGKRIGKIYYNPKFLFKGNDAIPFTRNQKMILKSDGRVNYAVLDQFVITSLTDFYQKINNIY